MFKLPCNRYQFYHANIFLFFFCGNKPPPSFPPSPSPEEFQYEKQNSEARKGAEELSVICKAVKIMLFLLGLTLRGKCELSINTWEDDGLIFQREA